MKKNYRKLLLLLSVGFVGMFLNAEARPLIQKVLSKGDSWMLTINGERDSLLIRGGKGSQTTNGGFKLNYHVAWGKHSGVLKGESGNNNSSQFVTLQLIRTNGSRVECRGYIARDTDDFMAGTCGSKRAPGAWYAIRDSNERGSNEEAKVSNETCGKQEQSCQYAVDRLKNSNQNLNNKYLAANNTKQRCQSSLKQCYQEQLVNSSQVLSKKSFTSFNNKINGVYYAGGGDDDKSDSGVQEVKIPGRPGSGSDLGNWLIQHNNALLGVTLGVLSSSDRNRFNGQERQKCNGNIYCEMAFRQQVIGCALDLGC
jgi:hypothetical protein